MKPTTFDLMRVWAAITGIALTVWFFVALYMGGEASPVLPMLVAAIGGFELMLYVQDVVLRRKRHG